MDEKQFREKKRSRLQRLSRILRLIVPLTLVLGLVFLAAGWDLGGLDSVRRLISYGKPQRDETGLTAVYEYNRDSSNRFARTREGLAVVSQTRVTLLRTDGAVAYTADVDLKEPAVVTGGPCTAVYDVGGQTLYLFRDQVLVLEYTTENGQSIFGARLNERGYLALVAGETGYKAKVTVYDPQGEAIFAFGSANRFILDAVVTADNRQLVVAAADAVDGAFFSTLIYYEIDTGQSQPQAELQVEQELVLALENQSGGIAAVGENALIMMDADGKAQGKYSYDNFFLRGWALMGEGFSGLLLGHYKSGSVGELLTLDAQGEVIARLAVDTEVLDLSAAGGYLAVLYSDELVIYTNELAEYAVCKDTEYARGVLMGEDGAALLIGGAKAWLVLP